MNFPVSAETARWLALPLGIIFGVLLHRGGVANYNVIVNQFRFKDFTVLKVMFTAIIVGGIGVLLLKSTGHAQYHIKPANMLGVALGATLFGVGMVLYGYCPGTGLAAMATGSLHAMVGFASAVTQDVTPPILKGVASGMAVFLLLCFWRRLILYPYRCHIR